MNIPLIDDGVFVTQDLHDQTGDCFEGNVDPEWYLNIEFHIEPLPNSDSLHDPVGDSVFP